MEGGRLGLPGFYQGPAGPGLLSLSPQPRPSGLVKPFTEVRMKADRAQDQDPSLTGGE